MGSVSMKSPAVMEIMRKQELKKGNGILSEITKSRAVKINSLPIKVEKVNTLEDGMWEGRRCFIIGGGPSLRDFDFSILQDELTIGINAAFLKIDPSILFAMDKRFYNWATKGLYGKEEKEIKENIEKYNNLKAIKVRLALEPGDFKGVKNITCAGDSGFSESLSSGIYHGQNSGYGALNLACILGCNKIYLLGFDMDTENPTHWHEGHPGTKGTGDMSTFSKAYSENLEAIKKKAMVINCNPNSKLKCFEFGELPEIKKKPIFISNFDKGIKNAVLERQLQKLGLKYYIEYDSNKQKLIQSSMENFDRDVVYVDQGATITKFPEEIFNFKGDYGCFENHVGLSRELRGLQYFRNNERGKKLVKDWQEKGDINKALSGFTGKIGYFKRQTENRENAAILNRSNLPGKKRIKYKKNWVLVSFYTAETPYEKEVNGLIDSITGQKIDYHIFARPARSSWRDNLNHKSDVILEAMKLYPGKDIVFVDADAEVKVYPGKFDELSSGDLYHIAAAFHRYNGSAPPGSLLSGTLWIKNNNMGKAIVELWHKRGIENPEVRHQHCLRLAIEEMLMAGNLVFIYRLDTSYTYIFDYNYHAEIKPVILHNQASRRFKKDVGESSLRDSNFTAKDGGYDK